MSTAAFNLTTEALAISGKVTRDRVIHMIKDAAQNANETPLNETTMTWNEIFVRSLEVLLSVKGVSPKVTKWFAVRGITA